MGRYGREHDLEMFWEVMLEVTAQESPPVGRRGRQHLRKGAYVGRGGQPGNLKRAEASSIDAGDGNGLNRWAWPGLIA